MLARLQPSPSLLILLSLAMAQVAVARQSGTSGAGDHPLLNRFAGSEIIEYSQEQDVNYRLVLGNLRRITGRVVAEDSERIRGDLTRITYEIPTGFSGAEVIAFFQEQAAARNYSELFSCSGRGCGNSNHWANEVFDNRSLYGPERTQFYLALQTGLNGGPIDYAAVYVITRANRRLLAHVEILETGVTGGNASESISSLELLQSGALPVSGLKFDAQDRLQSVGELDQLAEMLRRNQSILLYIVAHLGSQRSVDTLDILLARTLRRAEQVREALIARGIDASRLSAQGVGPLAPLCGADDCEERVEIVVRAAD